MHQIRSTSMLDTDSAAAEARLRAREQVFALLSHEIRTPLNGVLGMAGLLASTLLDPTQQAYLATLRESGEHLLSLVNDVLDLAKLESGKIELEPVDTDIERLLQGVCELLSPRAHAAHLDIAWAAERGLPRVKADDGRLRQILFNLAGNAVKMTETGGVLITAERAKANPRATPGGLRLRFRVKDTGPGLAPESQAKVFEQFVQTDAGVRAGGVGLGLAIVKRLVEAFDGEVGVTSSLGEGAEFWFEAEFEVGDRVSDFQSLDGLTVAVLSPSSTVREASALQIRASGGRAVTGDTFARVDLQGCVAVLVDCPAESDADRLPASVGAVALLTPEARDRIEPLRAAGFDGYLIKPLRRASLVARVLAATTEQGARVQPERIRSDPAPPDRSMAEDERAEPDLTSGVRVLLAEDNPINALLARALLTREGCEVDRVSTGVEALEALSAAPYDLVLMDMRMPGMDGLTAVRALRERNDSTPVIALTANAFEDDRRACLEAGMDDFLTKPLDTRALHDALVRWSRPSARTAARALDAPRRRSGETPAATQPERVV